MFKNKINKMNIEIMSFSFGMGIAYYMSGDKN